MHTTILTTVEVVLGILAAMWLVAFAIAGARRLLHGPDVPEVINQAFYDKYAARTALEGWPHRFLVVFDIAVNVACRGQADETISGRAYRATLQRKLWGMVLNYWLDLIQLQHGPKAMVGDMYRAQSRLRTNSATLGLQ